MQAGCKPECKPPSPSPSPSKTPSPTPEEETTLPATSSQAGVDVPSSAAVVPGKESEGGGTNHASEINAVVEHYRTLHPRYRGDAKDTAKIRARLKEGYSVEDLIGAIDGCHRTPHNLGENENGRKYLGLELIMRDAKHVTQYLEAPQLGEPVLTEETRRTLRAGDSWLRHMEEHDGQQGSTEVRDDDCRDDFDLRQES